MIQSIKKRIYKIIDVSHHHGDLSWYFDVFLVSLILLNVLAMLLESVKPIHAQYENEFFWFEVFSVIVFTIEYILRIWVVTLHPAYSRPIRGRLKFALTPMAIIDLLAFLPFYLPFFGLDFRLFRVMRLFRIFRLFKIARYTKALNVIHLAVRKKKHELFISLVFTLFLLLITSTLMYFVENKAQPEHFGSIPETMWWGIATLTTVGYGDVYPITALGRFLGGLIAIIGIGMFALPTGILASGFSDALERSKKTHSKDICPTCGQDISKQKEVSETL